MATIHDLDLYRKDKPLGEQTTPCWKCDRQPKCTQTCERAQIWWRKFAKRFRRQCVIDELAGG